VLALLGFAANAVVIGPSLFWSFQPGAPRNDFVSFYTAPALLTSGGLYDLQQIDEEQARYGFDRDRQHKLAFLRPPFYAFLLSPLPAPYRSATSHGFPAVQSGCSWSRFLKHLALLMPPPYAGVRRGFYVLRGQTPFLFCSFQPDSASSPNAPYGAGISLFPLRINGPLPRRASPLLWAALWRAPVFLAGPAARLPVELCTGLAAPSIRRMILADTSRRRGLSMATARLVHGRPEARNRDHAALMIAFLTCGSADG
jgi:hypothetical protein